ncbi:MAG: YafY family transcriptional regulator [Desulfobacterales bacterium]|nr:YafY family transcriptional regulator [Desulfobacterales bacterium]
MKIDRLLAITLFLMNRRKTTARELSERFEVSVRTIQRDVESLTCAGVPIYADRGKEGGYRMMENYTVDRHFFQSEELSALTELVSRFNALGSSPALKSTEEKLKNLASGRRSSRKHDPVIMDFTPWGMDPAHRHLFQMVSRAVEGMQVLEIEYAAASGEITRRMVEPLSVIIKGASWYLYAHCRFRDAQRLFKLTRMVAVWPQDDRFDAGRWPRFSDSSKGPEDIRPETLFVLRFAPSAKGRITDYYNSDRLHFMPDGTIMGFFPLPEDEWVYGWILSFGPLVEVLEPPHARHRVAEIAQGLAQQYGKDSFTPKGR